MSRRDLSSYRKFKKTYKAINNIEVLKELSRASDTGYKTRHVNLAIARAQYLKKYL